MHLDWKLRIARAARSPRVWMLVLATIFFAWGQSADATTLQELRATPNLTPEELIRQFAGFKFKLFDEVQAPQAFLASQTGDCNDFATLASDILREKGYTTRLVAVYMERQTHVVCFVKEAGAYLDYNNRNKPHPLVSSDGTLRDISRKVALSFQSKWTSALEFKFEHGVRQAVASLFRTSPAAPASR